MMVNKKFCVYMVPSSVSGLVHIYIYVYVCVCDDMCIRTTVCHDGPQRGYIERNRDGHSFEITSQPFHGMSWDTVEHISPTPEN